MKNYYTLYKEAFSKLNAAQQQAVEQIEGPVMVIAGPGTGKTQVLAIRIAKMILETDISPYNILCLTFTDAAAHNMSERLSLFVGSIVHKVHIETFHSFANRIIEIHAEELGINDFEILTELEEYELFQQLIEGLPSDHILNKLEGDRYFIWKKLKKFFDDLEKENWANTLIEKIEHYKTDILTHPEIYADFYYQRKSGNHQKGDLKQSNYDALIVGLKQTEEAFKLYPIFKSKMHEAKRYTFNDMLLWTIKLFTEKPYILLRYQERFQYICVDEFQDTSPIQKSILDLLLNYWGEKANIFVVGDDDQSIYRFQGANMQNIDIFRKTYLQELTKIVIDQNYRSTPEILNTAEALICHNQKRLGNTDPDFNKHLHSNIKSITQCPTLTRYENIFDESLHIKNKIKALINTGTAPREIAILYRNHKISDVLVKLLSEEKIPLELSRATNILEEPLVEKLITLLEYIAIESEHPFKADYKLFEILHFDCFQLAASDIAILSLKSNRKTIKQIIIEQSPKDFFAKIPGKEITRIYRNLDSLIKDIHNLTIQSFILEVVQKMDLLKYIMQSDERLLYLELMNTFFNFIKQETRKQKDITLKKLLQRINDYKHRNLPITLTRTIGSSEGIQLMTCHKAKGLEFEHVFIVGCNATEWEDKRNPNTSFTLPENIFYHTQGTKEDKIEEERRLFFVAITRAKKYLYLSYVQYNQQGKELQKSQFITELQEAQSINETMPPMLTENERLQTFSGLLKKDQPINIALIEKQWIDSVLEKLILSPTHLNSYLTCPIKFYYQHIVNAPRFIAPNAIYGNAVHHALQKIMPSINQADNTQKLLEPVGNFLNYFEQYMYANKEIFTNKDFDSFIKRGQKNLPLFYEHHIQEWKKQTAVLTEIDTRKMGNIVIEDVPLRGILDKLIFKGNTVTIIDYKTGAFSKSLKIKKRFQIPNESSIGGDYWRQAVFYKLLLDRIPNKLWKGDTVIFEFVEPEEGQFWQKTITITPEDEKILLQQIKNTYLHIQNHDFNKGCGQDDCAWCNFIKTYNLNLTIEEEAPM